MKVWFLLFSIMAPFISQGLRADRIADPGRLTRSSNEESQMNDLEMIKKAILVGYIEGIHGRQDKQLAGQGFHEDFALLIPKGDALRKINVHDWLKIMKELKEQDPGTYNAKTECFFEDIDVTDTAACAKLNVSKNGKRYATDYMLLYKFNGQWKIVSKIFKTYK